MRRLRLDLNSDVCVNEADARVLTCARARKAVSP
jgi:hypothetical protein